MDMMMMKKRCTGTIAAVLIMAALLAVATTTEPPERVVGDGNPIQVLNEQYECTQLCLNGKVCKLCDKKVLADCCKDTCSELCPGNNHCSSALKTKPNCN
ncbi:hypothetical protein CASFOL_039923 [Castilleja foliolosa]|uniref:Uncharacterized protein n=1 Tax=Castilleja foliolosa TaxID=1961234 RepID=A0ABD3BH46_9LAMI